MEEGGTISHVIFAYVLADSDDVQDLLRLRCQTCCTDTVIISIALDTSYSRSPWRMSS